jgi:transposase
MQDKDVIVESLLKRIEELQRQLLAALEREGQKDKFILEQAEEISKLAEDNLKLQERIARLEKNSSTSSKPPSSDITNPPDKPVAKKKKRKRGGQKGHKKHTRTKFTQEEIDETIVHKLSPEDVVRRNLIELPQTESALQQVSLPDKLFYVTDHHVQLYMDKNGNEVKATLPPEVRDCGLFAPDMMALTAYFKGKCHGSYSTVEDIFVEVFGLEVSAGFLTKVCVEKVSKSMAGGYDEVAEHIKNAPVVGSDETGHKNPAFKSAWTWCWQTPAAALFYNTGSRGSDVLKKILGEDFAGVIVFDYFSANRKFIEDLGLLAQFCFAHLIRDIKFLTTLPYKNLVDWAEKLLAILSDTKK